MDDVRKLAIMELGKTKMDSAEKVELWYRFRLDADWVLESLKDICTREAHITEENMENFGPKLSSWIAQARERIILERLMVLARKCQNCPCGLYVAGLCAYCRHHHPNPPQIPYISSDRVYHIVREFVPDI